MGYSLLGVLWERGWKTVGTKQGPTPNSRVNTLKNRPGGSCRCKGHSSAGAGEVVPITEEGAAEHTRRRPNQQAHGTVSKRRGGASTAGIALGQWDVRGKGHCQATPGLLSQRWCTEQPGLCPSHCRSPQYVPAGISRVVQRGQREKKRGRGQPILPPRLLLGRG